MSATIQDIKRVVINENPSIEELIVRFGDQVSDHWEIRKARREALQESTQDSMTPEKAVSSTALKQLNNAANIALRAGFFRPIKIELKDRRKSKPIFKKAGEEILVISDIHAPDHDPHALDVAIQICQSLNLDRLIVNGDGYDVHALSKYTPAADKPYRFVDERAEAVKVFALLREFFPETHIQWIHGNHDRRPEDFIARVAPALQGLFTLEEILGLSSLGFDVVNEGRIILGHQNPILVKHGTLARKNAGYSVHAEMDKSGMSVIMGHTHRFALVGNTGAVQELNGKQPLKGAEGGSLANLRPSYLPAEDTADWQHAALVVTIFDNGLTHIEPVEIHEGYAMFRGLLFKSRLLRDQ
jgi:predicted phosphodiesterase